MKVTIRDIADKLGVSTTAVSLVLNNRDNRISPEKKELIIRTAKEMNYHPNQAAVTLVKKNSRTIGLIIPDPSNMFFADLTKGVGDAVAREKMSLVIVSTNDIAKNDLSYLDMLIAAGADAIILTIASDSTSGLIPLYQNAIEAYGKPVVMVDRYVMSIGCSAVTLNHRKGAYVALQHLFSLGHRKIACLTGPRYLLNTSELLEGVRAAYRDYDIPFDEKFVIEGNYQVSGGIRAAEQILREGCTAVFSFNDMMAYGLYKKFGESGVRVPEDISVVGFDDVFFSELLDPPLTTIKQPAYLIGEGAAMRALYEVQHPEEEKQTTFFEPALKIRKSTRAI